MKIFKMYLLVLVSVLGVACSFSTVQSAPLSSSDKSEQIKEADEKLAAGLEVLEGERKAFLKQKVAKPALEKFNKAQKKEKALLQKEHDDAIKALGGETGNVKDIVAAVEEVRTSEVRTPIEAVWGVEEWQPAPHAEILKVYYGAAFYIEPDQNSRFSKDDKNILWSKLDPIHGDPAGGRTKWFHVLDKYGNEVSGSPFSGESHDVPAAIPSDGHGLWGSYHNDAHDRSLNDITNIANKQWPVIGNTINIPEVKDDKLGGDPISGHKKYLFIVAKSTFGNCFIHTGSQDDKAVVWSLPEGPRPEGQNQIFHREADWTYVATNKVIKVAVYKNNDVWGVTSDRKLVHFDGTTWSDQGVGAVGAIDISVGADGIPWRVGTDNKIYIKSGASWELVQCDGKVVHIAARTKDEAWAVMDDGRVMQFTKGVGFKAVAFTEGKASYIDVADYDGTVWAISDQGSLFEYRDSTWKQLPGGNLSCIAVQSEKEAWAIDKNHQIFHWDGKAWTQVGGALTSISVSHYFDVKAVVRAPLTEKELRDVAAKELNAAKEKALQQEGEEAKKELAEAEEEEEGEAGEEEEVQVERVVKATYGIGKDKDIDITKDYTWSVSDGILMFPCVKKGRIEIFSNPKIGDPYKGTEKYLYLTVELVDGSVVEKKFKEFDAILKWDGSDPETVVSVEPEEEEEEEITAQGKKAGKKAAKKHAGKKAAKKHVVVEEEEVVVQGKKIGKKAAKKHAGKKAAKKHVGKKHAGKKHAGKKAARKHAGKKHAGKKAAQKQVAEKASEERAEKEAAQKVEAKPVEPIESHVVAAEPEVIPQPTVMVSRRKGAMPSGKGRKPLTLGGEAE